METAPHPEQTKILAALRPLLALAGPVEGDFFRCVSEEYAHDFISGEGARIHGGRWNGKGLFRTVYLSDSPETALGEYLARARRMNVSAADEMPMVMAAVRVKMQRALDVNEAAVSVVLQLWLAAERDHWRMIQQTHEAVSQAIGRAGRELGLQGLRAGSESVPGGRNLIIFPDALSKNDLLALSKPRIPP